MQEQEIPNTDIYTLAAEFNAKVHLIDVGALFIFSKDFPDSTCFSYGWTFNPLREENWWRKDEPQLIVEHQRGFATLLEWPSKGALREAIDKLREASKDQLYFWSYPTYVGKDVNFPKSTMGIFTKS